MSIFSFPTLQHFPCYLADGDIHRVCYPFRVVMLFLYVVFKFMFYFGLSPRGRVFQLIVNIFCRGVLIARREIAEV